MKNLLIAVTAGLLLAAGLATIEAQDHAGRDSDERREARERQTANRTPPPAQTDETAPVAAEVGWIPVEDPYCTFFGPDHDKYVEALQDKFVLSNVTEDVAGLLPPSEDVGAAFAVAGVTLPSAPGGSRTDSMQNQGGIIDKYVFQKMAQVGVTPAPGTTDWEFIRRATLDLTGRIPTSEAVLAFVGSTNPNKRTELIDTLLARPEWVDKWTIWFGDLYENNSTNDLGANRFIQGVVRFNEFLRGSLQGNKPYDQMVRELIAATGTNSHEQGDLNFLPGGVMGGGPVQDVFDKQAALISEKFLGMAHLDCLLCHNGRGHLDSLSLWGYFATRNQAWGMASFLSHTSTRRVTSGQIYFWSIQNDVNGFTQDYRLNTQTGNRPARGATNSTAQVAPAYITGGSPSNGEPYRAALARLLTADPQFARATVNYIWEYFFGIGIVSPSNQFDPLRLDPDHPPADCPLEKNPCTLQASHPRLLNELAQQFVNSGYDLKWLMRAIANSRAYQLSSRYSGTWNPTNDRLFARKLVRRLWSEEIHDAITQSTGIGATYTNANWNPQTVNMAMQLPEPLNTGGNAANLLNAFLRGDRDTAPRNGGGAIPQALALMNDNFVMSRVTSNNAQNLLTRLLPLPDDQLVGMLYLNILSRLPSAEETATALANLRTNRTQEAQTLYWSLFNKVDFIFNY